MLSFPPKTTANLGLKSSLHLADITRSEWLQVGLFVVSLDALKFRLVSVPTLPSPQQRHAARR